MMVESPIFDIVPICEPWCWNIYQHLPNINCPVIGRLYQHHGAYGVYRLPIWMVNVVRDPIPRHWKPMEWAEKTPAGWWAGAMCKWVGVDFWSTKMMTVSMNMTKNMNMNMNMMMMNANMNMMNVNMKMLMMMMMMMMGVLLTLPMICPFASPKVSEAAVTWCFLLLGVNHVGKSPTAALDHGLSCPFCLKTVRRLQDITPLET